MRRFYCLHFALLLFLYTTHLVQAQDIRCSEEQKKRLFSCSVAMTKRYTDVRSEETVKGIINAMNSLNGSDYQNEKCSDFWSAALCARAVSQCSHSDLSGSIQVSLKGAFAHGFFICSNHTNEEVKNMKNCRATSSNTACTQRVKGACDVHYYECIIDVMRRECPSVKKARQFYTMCLIQGYRSKDSCAFGSFCSYAFKDNEKLMSSAGSFGMTIGLVGLGLASFFYVICK